MLKKVTGQKTRYYLNYIYAFIIPILLLMIIMIYMGITPFGDTSMLIWDAEYQYKDYFGYLWDVFHNKASLEFFSGKSIGGKMSGIYGYYLSSPLNILLVLFEKNQIPEFLTFITLIRCGLCGLSCEIYLLKRYHLKASYSIILAICYALMEYVIYYCRNIMWLDGVIMLPIVALGVYEMVHFHKKNILWISVAVSIVANWYTGYMVCFMGGVYFIYEYCIRFVGQFIKNIKEGISVVFKFVLTMLGGVLTSMGVLLPACLALVGGKATKNAVIGISGKVNFDLIHFCRGFDVSGYANDASIPLIFCGSMVVFCVLYYFMDNQVSIKERIITGIWLFFLAASFCLHDLELLWTGLVESYSFFWRFGFVFSFAMISIAAKAFMNIEKNEFDKRAFVKAGLLLVLGWYVLYYRKELLSNTEVQYVYLFVILILIFLSAWLNKKSVKNGVFIGIFLVTILELEYNAIIAFKDYSSSANTFATYVNQVDMLLDELNEDSEGEFYRLEKDKGYLTNINKDLRVATCESAMFGYNSIEFYSSAYDDSVDLFMAYMGYSDLTSRQIYPTETYWNSPMLLMDSLLSIKYVVLDERGYGYDEVKLSTEQPFNGEKIYKNNYALPLGYNVAEGAIREVDYGRNPFENHEILLENILGKRVEVYSWPDMQSKGVDSDGFEVYTVNVDTDGPLYLYVDGSDIHMNYGMNNCALYVNDKFIQNICTRFKINSVYLGDYFEGDTVEVKIQRCSDKEGVHNLYTAQLDIDYFEAIIMELSEHSSSQLNISKNTIEGTYITDEASLVLLSVPYEEEWEAYIDGEQVEIKSISGMFLGLNMPEGTHEVCLRYKNPVSRWGIIFSLVGIVSFLIWTFWEKRISLKL